MNTSLSDPTDGITAAVKSLFKSNDIIEVRAWDKKHEVFTGRYKYGKRLIETIKLFDQEGCDVYYVLNPVGNTHGLRDMSKGGLCTWEADVPHRRWFLLDFDPIRQNKIATDEQYNAAHKAATEAKTWLELHGWAGIILAASGNGVHLLVPCDLPNDTASKELVRRAQRAVSIHFSTPEVEVECFPDSNRLVRAYGSTNKKGDETEQLKHRKSGLLIKPVGACDPTEVIKQFVAANPVADVQTIRHTEGEGDGPFTRDLLYARLEAWRENWQGEDDEEFVFEETDRRDGFRIWCPGNFAGGWPDGEAHGDCYETLNDSTIVWCEDGWPRFRCSHNHCGEGAEHGKKTWKHLQEFYDPDRSFHKIIEEMDVSSFNIDFADAGNVYTEATPEEVAEATSIQFEPSIREAEPKPKPEPEPEPKPRIPKLRYMPEDCMYGWLGTKARELQTPLGWAYPASLTAFAATITPVSRSHQIRPTLYTCLIGGVHTGKSKTVERAAENTFFEDPTTVKWTVPGSDRGLLKLWEHKKKKDAKKDGDAEPEPEFSKTRLLAQDELRNTINKSNINGSSLPSVLCTLWTMDEAGAADKTGEHQAKMTLNILGALKAEDVEDFMEVFGKETTAGLYDRFVFGIAPDDWEWNLWEPNAEIRKPSDPKFTQGVYDMMNEWRKVDVKSRGRLAEIALRIAYISSAANHDMEITAESITCALKFCEWQEVIRGNYKAGLGDNLDSQATNAILMVLEKMGEDRWVRWRDISTKKNWYRKYGASTLSRVRESMVKSGLMMEQTIEVGGKDKRTGLIRLHTAKDDV